MVGLANGLKLITGSVGPLYAETVTTKFWVTRVPSLGSVAVTVMVAVSPALAEVVSMCKTPLGLVEESATELMTTGVIGCESSPEELVVTATLDRSVSVCWPETS